MRTEGNDRYNKVRIWREKAVRRLRFNKTLLAGRNQHQTHPMDVGLITVFSKPKLAWQLLPQVLRFCTLSG